MLLNILYPPDGIGGSEKSTQYLARGLSNLGHSVHVVSQALSMDDQSSLDENIRVTRVGSPPGYQPNVLAKSKEEMLALKTSFKGRVTPFSKTVADMIEEERPDLVHCNVVPRLTDIWRYCHNKKVPVIQTLRSYSIMCSTRMIEGGRNNMCWCAECRAEYEGRAKASANVNAVVGISEHILNTFLHNGFFAKSPQACVIGNSYEAETTNDLPVLWGNGKRVTLGYLGRIHQSKGIETILAALHQLNDDRLVLKIGGSGNPEYINYLRTRYSSPRIEFLGYVKPHELIEQIDVMCVPSTWHEPFGRVNVEALAHGRPVIGARRGGIPEIITEGVTGWLYEPYSIEQISRIFNLLLEIPASRWRELRDESLKEAKRYSVETIATQYQDLYYNAVYGK